MPLRHRSDQSTLVVHQLDAARQRDGARLGQFHRGARASHRVLEGVEQWPDQLPPGEVSGEFGGRHREVGHLERVGELGGDHRTRQHLALQPRDLGFAWLDGLLLDGRVAGATLHLAHDLAGPVRHLRIGLQDHEERGLPRGALRQDRRDAVEPFEHAVALGVGERLLCSRAYAFLTRQQRHSLETRPKFGPDLTAADRGLDLADGAREDGHHAVVVALAGLIASAAVAARAAITLSGQPTLLSIVLRRCA